LFSLGNSTIFGRGLPYVWHGEVFFISDLNPDADPDYRQNLTTSQIMQPVRYNLSMSVEVCPLKKSDLKGLDFVVTDRFFMKLF